LVYEAVRRAWGTPVIVDATKNPGRLRALYVFRDVPLRLIYLLRDGRAVCRSRMRREGVSMKRAAEIWRAEHRRQRLAQADIPADHILRVRYEDLCRDACAELTRICAFLGLDYQSAMLRFREPSRHNLGGNP